jgi:hypothetical protein
MTGANVLGRRAGRMSAPIVLVAVLAVLMILSGCAAIPTSGPVVDGRAAGNDPREGLFQVIPDGPAQGADAVGIVTGFLRAAAGFSNDHRVARSFLTPQRRLLWRPDASVAVYPAVSSLRYAEVAGSQPSATAAAGPTPAPSSAARAASTIARGIAACVTSATRR